MSIVKMKKLRAIALRDQLDGMTQALVRLGCVQVKAPEGMLQDPEVAAMLRPERAGVSEARTQLSQLQSALKVLEQYAPMKKKLLSSRPMISEEAFLDDTDLEGDIQLAEQINEWESSLRRMASDESRIRSEIESMQPWVELDAPLDGAGTKSCGMALGSAIAEIDMQSVSDAAESVTQDVQIILVSDDEVQHCFAVIAMRSELGAVMDAIRGIGCTQVVFPGITGTARENIDQRKAQLEEIAQKREQTIALITAEGPKQPELRLSTDRMTTEEGRLETIERLSGTDSIVALEGWCPADRVDDVEALLGQFDCAWELEDPVEEEYPEVPVSLKNKRFVKPMNIVTDMYSLPAYDGVDPNPLMVPFFVLFYGIMMADMGYGLLMMIASIVAIKKIRPRGGAGYLMSLMGMCGITTFIFGALTGGFFGDLLPEIAGMIDPDTTFTAMPALFTPLGNTIMILIGSLVLGVIQIFTGMIVSVIRKCQNGEGLSALFDEGAWWFILFGVGFLFLVKTLGIILLIIGCVLLIVGQFVTKKSFVGGLTGLVGAIYNGVTGYFSDILSYSRLMALMLAGSVIAMVFNMLGAMTGNAITFAIIAIIGNALNLGLNLLGCFVHDLRLQVLEFFGRFYKDGGKPFKPLNINTKYVDVIKEET